MSPITPLNGSSFLRSHRVGDSGSSGAIGKFIPFQLADVEQSLPSRFEQQVARHPENIAVKGKRRSLTYDALNRWANRVAQTILSVQREGGEKTVGLFFNRDAPLIAALLGVLKAGHIYVPIDPAHPALRANKMLDDSGAGLVLTDRKNQNAARDLASSTRRLLNVEDLDRGGCDENGGLQISPETPAYIIYTSGSTGAPKGVVQNHRNVLHNILRHTNSLQVSSDDRLTWLASASTGQAVTDIYCSLLNGATLCPFALKEDGLVRLAEWMRQERITIYHSSASIFRHLVDGAPDGANFKSVRVVKLGSERVFKKDVEAWQNHFPTRSVFVNALSSTEAGMFRELIINREATLPSSVVPVGFPIDDVEVLLLDDFGEKVEFDTPGEICVRSRYLAPGYWRRSDLTSKAFLADPGGSAARTFHTGDLGRVSPEGCLEYLGRKDSQVKIRGFRVEIAEVEAALLESCDLTQAAVLADSTRPGATRLKAYIVPRSGSHLDLESIRDSMKSHLPDHMIPSEYILLDSLPLTSGGKVDRQALAATTPESVVKVRDKRDLSTLELEIKGIWERLLGVQNIGVADDFFELGGDSLLAVRMMDVIETSIGVRVPLGGLYSGATVTKLASSLLDANRDLFRSPLVPVKTSGAGTPFYYLHGDFDGGGFYCAKLARQMGLDSAFYAIPPHGLDGGEIPGTIEEMAAERLKALLAFQPSGPYLLGGHCNGGMVAFEMAQQLAKIGQKVDLLLLVDVLALNAPFSTIHALSSVVGTALRKKPSAKAEIFLGARRMSKRWQAASREGRRAEIVVEKLRKLAGTSSASNKPAPEESPKLDGSPEPSPRYLAYHQALDRYVPKKYPGRVVLFRTESRKERTPGDDTLGWRHVAPQLEICPIPGDHVTCLTDHLEILAARMAPYLRK